MTIFDLPRPQDKLAILKRIGLFSSCTDDQLQLVAARSRLVEYKKGEIIYREGDRAEALQIVASGRLQVYTLLNGQKQVFTVLHNGDTFGEVSLLTGETHSATVEALNDTLVLQLEKRDFDELINRIPSLVLYLSRLLSKRLRTKGQAAEVGEATVVAVYSAAKGVGRTLFAVALGAALRHETGRSVVVVDFTTPEGQGNPLLGSHRAARILPLSLGGFWPEETLDQEIHAHPLGFDFLYAHALAFGEEGELFVAPLVNGLTKRYSYVVLDLPVDLEPTVLKALTQADLTYLVTDTARETVMHTNALVQQLREAMHRTDEQIRAVVNLMESPQPRLRLTEIGELVGVPVAAALPNVPQFQGRAATTEELATFFADLDSPYAMAVRRAARQLGGVLVGLALGSGAALGLAHIGVLKVIEREKIPVDLIAGSSVGALIGALWAIGKSADELEALAKKFKNPWAVRALFVFDFGIPVFSLLVGFSVGWAVGHLAGFWTGVLLGLIVGLAVGVVFGPLVGGPIQGARVEDFLERVFGDKTFEDTRVPVKIVAAQPMLREEVIFESGRLADAVRASVSIPGIFKPPRRMGRICVDGGVMNPIPVSVLKKSGAKRIIAVNVFATTEELTAHAQVLVKKRAERDAQLASHNLIVRLLLLLQRELRRSFSPLVFDVIMRSMQAMEYQIAEVGCHEADLTLRPTLPGSHWLEFYHPEKFIRRGEEEALRLLPVLKRVVGLEPVSLTTPPPAGTITSHD